LIGRRLRPLLGAFFAFATLLAATGRAGAEVKIWNPSGCGFNCTWQTAENWDPVGVPGTGDNIFVDTGGLVLLKADTDKVGSLDLTGATLLAQGFVLRATTMTLRGSAQGVSASVVINPTSTTGFFADRLRIGFGGLLTLDVAGSSANIKNMTIDFGGMFRVKGAGRRHHRLRVSGSFDPGTDLDNNGTIALDEGTTEIEAFGEEVYDLDGEFEVGIVTIASGAVLEFLRFHQSDDFDGTLNVGDGGSEPGVMEIGSLAPASWTIGPGGVVTLDNGEISSELLTSEGDIRGNGSLMTEVRNSGAITPGLSVGSLHIELDYRQFSGGTLGIELGGLSAGSDYDVLSVGGVADLDGTLDVSLVGEFQPTIGDEFTILTAAGVIPGTGQLVEGVKGSMRSIYRPLTVGSASTSFTILAM